MSLEPYSTLVSRLFPGAELQSMERLTGGVSADVHRLDLILTDGGATSVVLRAHGASHSGHSAALEYQLLRVLYRGGVPVPEPLHVDVSGGLLRDPFLVMAFAEGTSTVPGGQEGQYIDAMADTLATVHAVSTAELPALPARVDPLPVRPPRPRLRLPPARATCSSCSNSNPGGISWKRSRELALTRMS